MDLNGKEPLHASSSEWPRSTPSARTRTSERRRVRRRARRPNNIRAKIRVRVWLACTGALLVMAVVLYLALGRERPGESGFRVGAAPATAALVAAPATAG